ncbi:TPA: hypothetical protein ACF6GT_002175 [Legionella pneumophila]
MNITGFKIIVLIGLLGLGLTACTPKTTPAPAHPEVGYEGGFGGDGSHNHQPKND